LGRVLIHSGSVHGAIAESTMVKLERTVQGRPMDIHEREMNLWSEALGSSSSDILTVKSENSSAAPLAGVCDGESHPGPEAGEQE